jgi:hypothetical protein
LKSSQVEEFTELHKLINDKHFHLALDMLKTAKVDANILAIAPKNCQKGAGNSALHFLAFSGSGKHVDKKAALRAFAESPQRIGQNGAAHCSIARQPHSCESSAGCRRRNHFYFYSYSYS